LILQFCPPGRMSFKIKPKPFESFSGMEAREQDVPATSGRTKALLSAAFFTLTWNV